MGRLKIAFADLDRRSPSGWKAEVLPGHGIWIVRSDRSGTRQFVATSWNFSLFQSCHASGARCPCDRCAFGVGRIRCRDGGRSYEIRCPSRLFGDSAGGKRSRFDCDPKCVGIGPGGWFGSSSYGSGGCGFKRCSFERCGFGRCGFKPWRNRQRSGQFRQFGDRGWEFCGRGSASGGDGGHNFHRCVGEPACDQPVCVWVRLSKYGGRHN